MYSIAHDDFNAFFEEHASNLKKQQFVSVNQERSQKLYTIIFKLGSLHVRNFSNENERNDFVQRMRLSPILPQKPSS
ncbi:MAG: hypothetical protein S4CHLAM2_07040 [Chlamydiales bacterium]|nr:hypothetical protein [Chlamydiales bacterium]